MKTIIRNFLSVLRRFKMATLLNVLGLSVAFAAFMVIMMQLDYEYNFDRFHTNSDCIYRVEGVYGSTAQAIVSRPMANEIIASSPHIQAGAVYLPHWAPQFFTVEMDDMKKGFTEKFLRVDPSFTDVFEFEMVEGADNALEEPEKALISESLAKKIFGIHSATGSILELNGQNITIGGIYKDFPKNSLVQNGIFLPIPKDEGKNSWGNSSYELYIRLDNPVNSFHLMENFKNNFDISIVGDHDRNWIGDMNYRLTPVADIHFANDTVYDSVPKTSRQTLLVLFAIAIIIIVIAGINYTNFSTALTPIRIKSINTQKVLGGDERRIRVSLLVEAVSVCLIAFFIALLLVHLINFTYIISLLNAIPTLTDYPVIVAGTLLIALITGLLAGLYPSYYITSFQPALVLKGSFGLSPKGRKLRNVLIGVQFIASFTLIIGSSFMYLQNNYIQCSQLGFEKDELIITNINKTINNSQDAFTNQMKAFSGIQDVTYGEAMLSTQQQYMSWGRYYKGETINFQCLPVNYSFLKVMGINVTEGRDFRQEDELTRHGALIFNEKARLQYDMHSGDMIDSARIIGFIPDIKYATFHVGIEPMAFFVWGTENWGSIPNYAYIKVKAGSNLHAAISYVKTTLQDFDPDYPFKVHFFDEAINSAYEKEINLTSLITLFSLIAIFISIVGVFGLVVFESEYRKKEIGLRKILGSTTREILILFNKTYVRILCLCFILAAPVAYYAVTHWLENFAYKTPLYWWVFLASFAIVSLVTMITVTFQNWRTANENPVDSIKTE